MEEHDQTSVSAPTPGSIDVAGAAQGTLQRNIQEDEHGQITVTGGNCFSQLADCPAVELEFDDLSYTVRDGPWWKKGGFKSLLNGVSGKFGSGELTGIMGPSGSGKSTLMNILSGSREGGMKGEILVNGRPMHPHSFRKISAYIMQGQMLPPHLTAREAMMFSADLKLKENKEFKKEHVDEILATVGLLEAADTRTDSLSGVQRKRLAIALELVNNPPVMFLDQPTTGLDSVSCFHVVSLLKSLARSGHTIICTIHQPSAKIFELFDKMYILNQGRCIYQGSVPDLVPYLENLGLHCPSNPNPAEFIMEVVSGEYGDKNGILVAAAEGGRCPDDGERGSERNTDLSLATILDKYGYATSTFTQFCILSKHTYAVIPRDLVLTHFRFMSHLIMALLIGCLYWDVGNDACQVFNNTGCLFFSMFFLTFAALMPTILTFPLEMPVILREHFNNWYRLEAYFLARTLADIPFQVIFSVIYSSIVYWMTGQPPVIARFFSFVAFYTLTALVAQFIGFLIGAVAPSAQVATLMGPVLCVPVILFSGYFMTFDTIPVYLQWIAHVSYLRYGFEGVIHTVYGMNRTELALPTLTGMNLSELVVPVTARLCKTQSPEEVLEWLHLDRSQISVDFSVLGAFFLIIFLGVYLAVYFRVRLNR